MENISKEERKEAEFEWIYTENIKLLPVPQAQPEPKPQVFQVQRH